MSEFFGGYILICLLFWAMMIPTFVAYNRNHKAFYSIFTINLFLGWTFIGWVICLAWSLSPVQKLQEVT